MYRIDKLLQHAQQPQLVARRVHRRLGRQQMQQQRRVVRPEREVRQVVDVRIHRLLDPLDRALEQLLEPRVVALCEREPRV
jgi:hypothetical protein